MFIFSMCYVSILSVCYVRFLVCVLCGASTRRTRAPRMWLVLLASGRSAAAGCKPEHYQVRCSWLNDVSALDNNIGDATRDRRIK